MSRPGHCAWAGDTQAIAAPRPTADYLLFPVAALCLLSGLALAATTPGAADVAGTPSSHSGPNDQSDLQTYDIPAQSLAVALDHYAAVSGRAAVFASALAAGRRSAPVHGHYDSKSALRLLLTDTGLSASEVVSGNVVTFVLKGAVLPVPLAASPASAERGHLEAFDGAAQAAVWQALCNTPDAMPGSYRALLRFNVDPAGRIYHARLLSSTGDGQRDAALLASLQRVHMTPPPAGLAQPLTMLMLPQAAGHACGEGR